MIRTKIEINDVQIRVIEKGIFTAGMVGAQVEILFTDPLWNDLEKVVTFLCGREKKDAILCGNIVEIPHEVLRRSRQELYIGLCGYDANHELCLPTVWADLGEVRCGADPSGDPGMDPSLPVWAELLDKIGDLGALLKEDYASKVWVQEGFQPKGDYLTEQDISGKLEISLPEDVVTKPDLFAISTVANFTNMLEAVGLQSGKRLKLDTMTEEDTDLPLVTTGYIPVAPGSIIRVNEDFAIVKGGYAGVITYDANKTPVKSNDSASIGGNTYFYDLVETDAGGNIRSFRVNNPQSVAYIRICNDTSLIGRNPVLTVNEEITYTEGYGDKLNPEVKVDYSQIVNAPQTEERFVALSPTMIDSKMLHGDGYLMDYSNPAYKVSEAISVSEGEVYRITTRSHWEKLLYAFYNSADASKDTLISGYKANGGADFTILTNEEFVIPGGVTFMRVAAFTDYDFALSKKETVKTVMAEKAFAGKKWVPLGDSLTAGACTDKCYYDYIEEATGLTVYSMGVGGSGYMNDGSGNQAFYKRISGIPADADVITIFGSGNDLSFPLGTPGDTGLDTICGCINCTLETVFANFPLANIGIITPTPWASYPPANSANAMELYSDALVEICKMRGIPCLDLYHCSGLRPWEETFRTLAYSKDTDGGVHPDETGHKIIAPRIKAFLESLLL